MRPFQYSIRTLLASVAVVAVACAAFSHPSYLWASGIWTATIAVLVGAVVAAIFATGRRRAFWASFAIFGWAHMVLVFAPWFDSNTGEFLLSRKFLDWLTQELGHQVPKQQHELRGIWTYLQYSQMRTTGAFHLVLVIMGQCFITLGLATAAGLVGAWLRKAAGASLDANVKGDTQHSESVGGTGA